MVFFASESTLASALMRMHRKAQRAVQAFATNATRLRSGIARMTRLLLHDLVKETEVLGRPTRKGGATTRCRYVDISEGTEGGKEHGIVVSNICYHLKHRSALGKEPANQEGQAAPPFTGSPVGLVSSGRLQ